MLLVRWGRETPWVHQGGCRDGVIAGAAGSRCDGVSWRRRGTLTPKDEREWAAQRQQALSPDRRESPSEDNDLSEGERIGVRDGQLRRLAADPVEAPGRTALQLQLRRPAGPADDLDVTPQHALRVAGAERLHRRFLGREPAGKMDRRMAAAHAVRDFAVGEDAPSESIAVALERRGDARNLRGIESQTDDGHASQA
jgi:hypothetical protein